MCTLYLCTLWLWCSYRLSNAIEMNLESYMNLAILLLETLANLNCSFPSLNCSMFLFNVKCIVTELKFFFPLLLKSLVNLVSNFFLLYTDQEDMTSSTLHRGFDQLCLVFVQYSYFWWWLRQEMFLVSIQAVDVDRFQKGLMNVINWSYFVNNPNPLQKHSVQKLLTYHSRLVFQSCRFVSAKWLFVAVHVCK